MTRREAISELWALASAKECFLWIAARGKAAPEDTRFCLQNIRDKRRAAIAVLRSPKTS